MCEKKEPDVSLQEEGWAEEAILKNKYIYAYIQGYTQEKNEPKNQIYQDFLKKKE